MQPSSTQIITLIAPCFNEAQVLPEFIRRIDAIAATLSGYQFEFLFIDDGSLDDTEAVLLEAAQHDTRIQLLSLSRNFGHQRAITAGLDFARGDYCIILDADLQDPPDLIPEIIAKLEEGYDLVHTVRQDRSVDSRFKRIPAQLFYRFMQRWVLPELPENAGDFKGFNRKVLLALRQYRERVRFLRGAFATLGFRQATLPYVRASRHAGESKYPLWQVLRFARDAIVSNSVLPLRLGFYFGASAFCAGFIWGGLSLLRQPDPLQLLIALVLLFGGAILMMLGAIGEYLKCIVLEVKQRPLYIIRAAHNIEPPESAESF